MARYEFSPELVDLAWQAAWASRDAFDRMKAASIMSHPELVHETKVGSRVSMTVDRDDVTTLVTEASHARHDFDYLSSMAGIVMSSADWSINPQLVH